MKPDMWQAVTLQQMIETLRYIIWKKTPPIAVCTDMPLWVWIIYTLCSVSILCGFKALKIRDGIRHKRKRPFAFFAFGSLLDNASFFAFCFMVFVSAVFLS